MRNLRINTTQKTPYIKIILSATFRKTTIITLHATLRKGKHFAAMWTFLTGFATVRNVFLKGAFHTVFPVVNGFVVKL
jgi:hypothetical protein